MCGNDTFVTQLNAKELILAKINCGDNLAKCHLYLLMLGFDIKDIVSFMTSPCVSLINDLTETNMMDSYITNLKIEDAIELVLGIIDPYKFLLGSTFKKNENGELIDITRTNIVFSSLVSSKLNPILVKYAKEKKPLFSGFISLSDMVQYYILARLDNIEMQELDTFKGGLDYESRKGLERMSDFVERLIYLILKTKNKYGELYNRFNNINEKDYDIKVREYANTNFNEDLDEFKKVYLLANETTTLGGVFLGLNQGLPGSKVDLLNKLRLIKETISTREKEFGINRFNFSITEELKNNEKVVKSKLAKFETLITNLKADNLLITGIEVTLLKAYAFDIINNFNIEYWLYNKKLTKDDIINDSFLGNQINQESIFNGESSISYRELVADYYNIIKGTWNIFDMMNRIPLFTAILDLLKTVYVMDKNSSIKSNLTNIIYDLVYKTTNYIDDRLNKIIIKYVDDLLITSFFREYNFSFPIYTNMEYLDSNYKTKIANHDRIIDLGNAPGRASFKLAFESIISKLKNEGTYAGLTIPNYKENLFLLGLKIYYDKYEIPRISLELDLMKINSTPNSLKVFLDYLSGLNTLKDFKINNISLPDWFIIYNLYVNLNLYGSDRLTSIFKNSIINKDSILEKYFKYVGKFDYIKMLDSILKDLEFNIQDLFIRMAPTISRSEESIVNYPYIRVKNSDGEYVIKGYNLKSKKYNEISTFPNKDMEDANTTSVSDEQKYNYLTYLMMPMKNQDFIISLREGILSLDLDVLVDTLITYSRRGLLLIIKENC